MAPPRKHDTDVILDAARTLVLAEGPRAASVAALAAASGAPAGTLYHRFGNRDGVLAAAWLRSLHRFQDRVLEAARHPEPLEAAVAMAGASVTFARDLPDDAQLLLRYRPADLLDAGPDSAFREQRAAMNAPLVEELHRVATKLRGSADPRNLDVVARAVVDLPNAALRRHTFPLPEWLHDDIEAAARALLSAPPPAQRS